MKGLHISLSRLSVTLLLSYQFVACDSDNDYSVGGTVSGLSGSGLVLQNNGADDLSIDSDGKFSFSTLLQDGDTYEVTVAVQPSGQNCSVDNASGVLDGADVDDVAVSCSADSLAMNVSAIGPKLLRFDWNDLMVDHYKLLRNPDGVSGYSQVGENLTGTTVDLEISLHLTDWVNVSYMLQACDSEQQCTDSEPINLNGFMPGLVGYLKAPDTDQTSSFGGDLSLSDDAKTMAIRSSSGVHIFERNGGVWSQQEFLSMHAGEVSLSSNGDVLAVGDPSDDWSATGVNGLQTDDTATDSGAVYVFARSSDVWSQQAYIKSSNSDIRDRFGVAIAISADGTTLAVAATEEDSSAAGIGGDQADNSAPNAGAVYLFVNGATGWSQQAYIKASNSEQSDHFGWDVALSTDGDTLAVASREEDSSASGVDGDEADNSAYASGAVYVFTRDGSNWNQQAYVKASNSDSGDRFGASIALSGSGDLLAVGATGEASSTTGVNGDQVDNSAGNAGAAYLFERNANEWQQTAYIKASNSESMDTFGVQVEISNDGNSLAVRASGEDSIATGINGDQQDNSAVNPGAIYLFTRNTVSWFQQAYVKASNTRVGESQICTVLCLPDNDEFGSGLALSGDGAYLAVGAYYEASPDQSDQHDHTAPGTGAVYLY